jgi:hypothetical protein
VIVTTTENDARTMLGRWAIKRRCRYAELNAGREETIGKHWEHWDERPNTGTGKGKRKNNGNQCKENAGLLDDKEVILICGTEC